MEVHVGDESPHLYKIDVGAMRVIEIPLTGKQAPAIIWDAANSSWGYAGREDRLESSIERSVSNSVDEFILSYLEANRQSCESAP